MKVGELLLGYLLEQLDIGLRVTLRDSRATLQPKLLEELLQDPVHQTTPLQGADRPAIFRSMGRLHRQNSAQEELERTRGPRLDGRSRRDSSPV